MALAAQLLHNGRPCLSIDGGRPPNTYTPNIEHLDYGLQLGVWNTCARRNRGVTKRRYHQGMQVKSLLEQHIAVFGGTGSGKTVLLSSFYGAAQEPNYLQRSPFNVLAEDFGQGTKLHRNYLGMRDSAAFPVADKFISNSYAFSIKLKDADDHKAAKGRQFEALRLLWHDYPGEWFEQDVSGPEEAQRRVDTFKSLLQSDVAILLVDGQKMIDNKDEEERYLKSLFGGFRNSILALKEDLLVDGKRIVQFPRIWILALSKADLLPDVDVYNFRDLVIAKASDELEEFRSAIAGILEGSEALAIGEDFMLLSSAKFEPGKIEVNQRIGVELLLPVAAILPFERHVRWADTKQLPAKVAENLLQGAGALAAALVGKKIKIKIPGKMAPILGLLGSDLIREAARLAGDKLHELNTQARLNRDNLTATLTQFKQDLADGEDKGILLRSQR